MVGQYEMRRRRSGILPGVLLQTSKLVRVDVHTRVKSDHRGPVPSGSGREHGVERGRRIAVPLEREEHERPELVERGVVRQLLKGLVAMLEGLFVVARLERGA